MKILVSEIPAKSAIERGIGLLNSIRILINVLYALLIYGVFMILPRPGDPELEYLTLGQMFAEHVTQLLVMVVGLVLIVMYWIQFNRQLGNLVRSTPLHASLAVVQMVCLMIYLYFVRFDMEFDGMTLALQMESIFLALAGFIGVFNWHYARLNGLTSDQIDKNEETAVLFSLLPEPIASLFTLPFAVLGPNIWTIAFLSIIPITWVLNRMKKRYQPESNS